MSTHVMILEEYCGFIAGTESQAIGFARKKNVSAAEIVAEIWMLDSLENPIVEIYWVY